MRSRLFGASAACLMAASVMLAPTAGASAEGCPVKASTATTGGDADGASLEPSISGTGRYVAFFSDATNLVEGDTNGWGEIFVYDRVENVVVRASVADDESEGNRFSLTQDISADGRFVAFGSSATNLVKGDTNDLPDTFLRDLLLGTTIRVSVAGDGSQAIEGGSSNPSLSATGRYVGFYSVASNLVPGDTNEVADVFVHDTRTRATERVSVSSTRIQADAQSAVYSGPALSDSGRWVAFESEATNLVPEDTNQSLDVFVHDRTSGRAERVSVAADGAQGNGESYWPSISADGRFVAFASKASNLVAGDTNDDWDIFVRDRARDTTVRVSVNSRGREGNAYSYSPSISGSGRSVAFWSYATNLVRPDHNRIADVFVHDSLTGETVMVSTPCGRALADGESILPAISDDGRFIAFESAATNLVAGDGNNASDVFVVGR